MGISVTTQAPSQGSMELSWGAKPTSQRWGVPGGGVPPAVGSSWCPWAGWVPCSPHCMASLWHLPGSCGLTGRFPLLGPGLVPVLLGGHLQPPQRQRGGLGTCPAWPSALQRTPVVVPAPHHLPPLAHQECPGKVRGVRGLVWGSPWDGTRPP